MPDLRIEAEGNSRIRIAGALDTAHLEEAYRALRGGSKIATADLSQLETLDTGGALFLSELQTQGAQLENVQADHQTLLDLISGLELKDIPPEHTAAPFVVLMERFGKGAVTAWRETLAIIAFVGQAAVELVAALAQPHRLRFPSIARHLEETGINAIPIVALVAFLISIVIAYQGVAQLRPFGGQQYTVNLVAISVLREMAVLLTAIMVAGRSGSAFAAEIGVMKVREEVDALQVTGITPFEVLVVPRLIALIIALPMLTFIADLMGLLGGMVISAPLLDMSPTQYVQRVKDAADGKDLLVGLVKAPVFAFFIGIVGCMHGLRVSGSAESVGLNTTAAVVKAIFLVLVLDAFFSIFFQRIGL